MKKAIAIVLVLVICLGMCACNQGAALTEASNEASEILKKAAEDSGVDIDVSCFIDEASKTIVMTGELSSNYQDSIDGTKRYSSMPGWLKEGVIEELEEEQLRADEKAIKFFLALTTSETAKQIAACFESTNMEIIYRYRTLEGRIVE